MKQIFKDSQKAGYGVKLLEAYRQDPKTAIEKALNYSQEFAKVSKYKQDLISYGFDSILFGLGCLSNINEPLSKGFDPYSKADDQIFYLHTKNSILIYLIGLLLYRKTY